ncbi:MAG TPA: hypothetical protein VLH12_06400, partial [Usitatibacter sp.]|nr:hypothetical protein [Usitatibacter sp.]
APVRVTAGNAAQDFEVDREPYETTLHFRGVEPGATTISFVIPHPESPQERGSGSDPRKLGIGLVSLRVIPK